MIWFKKILGVIISLKFFHNYRMIYDIRTFSRKVENCKFDGQKVFYITKNADS